MKFSDAAGSPIRLVAGTGPQPVLEAHSDDGFPRVVSIVLLLQDALPENQIDTTLADRQVFALVTAGLGAARRQFMVDWRDGAMLTLPAETITVAASYPAVVVAGVPDPHATPDLIAQAAIGIGTRASNDSATLTVRYGAVVAGSPVTLSVPRFAFDVALATSASAGFGGYTLTMLGAAAGNVLGQWQPNDPTRRARMPLGTRWIEISSARGVADNLSLIYGIDV